MILSKFRDICCDVLQGMSHVITVFSATFRPTTSIKQQQIFVVYSKKTKICCCKNKSKLNWGHAIHILAQFYTRFPLGENVRQYPLAGWAGTNVCCASENWSQQKRDGNRPDLRCSQTQTCLIFWGISGCSQAEWTDHRPQLKQTLLTANIKKEWLEYGISWEQTFCFFVTLCVTVQHYKPKCHVILTIS